jgi:hypothetical protein
MAEKVKKPTGLASPFLHLPYVLRVTPHTELHKLDRTFYEKIKREHWGWVSVLKHYAYLLNKACASNFYVIEVQGNSSNFRINLRKVIMPSDETWSFYKKDFDNRFLVISLSFGNYVPKDSLFDIKTSNTVSSKTLSVKVKSELDKSLLRCGAKMLKSQLFTKNHHMHLVLRDLNLLSD